MQSSRGDWSFHANGLKRGVLKEDGKSYGKTVGT